MPFGGSDDGIMTNIGIWNRRDGDLLQGRDRSKSRVTRPATWEFNDCALGLDVNSQAFTNNASCLQYGAYGGSSALVGYVF